ncbi:ABC transporter ATP-binding protein [Granulosicoccaceae sp. 1_MG-2023]|nr:ABC transporter ATP-binding protein [Granulosicoccaceae sp. 1_MG-2023]
MNGLELQKLTVSSGGRTLVNGVSASVPCGGLLGVIGPNGSGKSTLLRAVAQLLEFDGSVSFNGTALGTLTRQARAREIAYLAQDGAVAWPMRVGEFVSLGRLPHRGVSDSNTSREAVASALAAMELESLSLRRMDQLSGGERARARLARALAVDAPLLLADEPVAALDPYHQLNVMRLLRQQSERGRCIAVVLHDLTLTSRFCDQVLLMSGGSAVAFGDVRAVLTPANIQAVYQVNMISGEHEQQPYVIPWQCRPAALKER